MSESYWQAVRDSGMVVPSERPLAESAAELVAMLGNPRPQIRDSLAYRMLVEWLSSGAFDQTLAAMGDGLLPGLRQGLGNDSDDSVYRRSYSALLLAHIIGRDNHYELLDASTVIRWGDAASSWLVRERDHRGWTHSQGWAHAVAYGADLVTALASSRHFAEHELAVLMEVISDRLTEQTRYTWRHTEPDRLAFAVMTVLHRDVLETQAIESWLQRLGSAIHAHPEDSSGEWPTSTAHNISAFLRALQLQLSIGVNHRPALNGHLPAFTGRPRDRSDIVLSVLDQIRTAAPWLYRNAQEQTEKGRHE